MVFDIFDEGACEILNSTLTVTWLPHVAFCDQTKGRFMCRITICSELAQKMG
jgi:hypothetical protein